jgi:protein-histidine N-methyltransferase
LFETPQVEGND